MLIDEHLEIQERERVRVHIYKIEIEAMKARERVKSDCLCNQKFYEFMHADDDGWKSFEYQNS